jgi:hypothetical protein
MEMHLVRHWVMQKDWQMGMHLGLLMVRHLDWLMGLLMVRHLEQGSW